MSPKSNLVGNPAEPLSNEYSPATAGAQGASLTAKQGNKLVYSRHMIENLVKKGDQVLVSGADSVC